MTGVQTCALPICLGCLYGTRNASDILLYIIWLICGVNMQQRTDGGRLASSDTGTECWNTKGAWTTRTDPNTSWLVRLAEGLRGAWLPPNPHFRQKRGHSSKSLERAFFSGLVLCLRAAKHVDSPDLDRLRFRASLFLTLSLFLSPPLSLAHASLQLPSSSLG